MVPSKEKRKEKKWRGSTYATQWMKGVARRRMAEKQTRRNEEAKEKIDDGWQRSARRSMAKEDEKKRKKWEKKERRRRKKKNRGKENTCTMSIKGQNDMDEQSVTSGDEGRMIWMKRSNIEWHQWRERMTAASTKRENAGVYEEGEWQWSEKQMVNKKMF